jgi:hypothetical protein
VAASGLGAGGAGGGGGHGANGGFGGGGGGGPTIGIVESAASTTVQTDNSFLIGAPGPGGDSLVNPGREGERAQYKKLL